MGELLPPSSNELGRQNVSGHPVAVGDASQICDALAKYGTVVAYDAEGKPVKDAGNN
jgi:hypothetical protein